MSATKSPTARRTLVIACGAIARELVDVIRLDRLAGVEITCLPPILHNRPGDIPAAVARKIAEARSQYDRILVAYGDCGTGGVLDGLLEREGVERIPGAHCYEFLAGTPAFTRLADEEPGTFYLTDYLARNFDRLVVHGLGIDRHPELKDVYFANYRRIVYLSQREEPALLAAAGRAAAFLGLEFRHRHTGLAPLGAAIGGLMRSDVSRPTPRAIANSVEPVAVPATVAVGV